MKRDGFAVGAVVGTRSASFNQNGYTVGGGLEYAVTSAWSAKLEYLFLSFGGYSMLYTTTTPSTRIFYSRLDQHDIHAGINYKF